MLEILELKTGELEFLDTVLHKTRKKYYRLTRLLFYILGTVITIFLGLVLTRLFNIEFEMTPYLIILAFLVILSLISRRYIVNKFLFSSLSSFVLLINENNEITSVKVREWIKAQINEFSQYAIRFNQAIGFKCLIIEDGSLMVEIIVDENYPGQRLFNAINMDTIADFRRSMHVIFPDKKEWYFVLEDGSQWDEEELIEFNDEMKHARTPIILRNYFKI